MSPKTKIEILQNAYDKASKNGWVKPAWCPKVTNNNLAWDSLAGIEYWQALVYSHDFAKALWGEEDEIVWADDQRMETLPVYKYHLQQMVIADQPLAYLAENL